MEDPSVYIQLEKRKGKKQGLLPRIVEMSMLTVYVQINWKVGVKEGWLDKRKMIMTDK